MPPTPVRGRIDLGPLRLPAGRMLLVLFLTIDAGILLAHLSGKLIGKPDSFVFDLGADRSYGELLMYIKLAWIAMLLALVARRRRSRVLAAVAIASVVLLVEDAFLLHERVGWALEDPIANAFPALRGHGILAIQAGELMWLAVVGTSILVMFVVAYRRGSPEDRRAALSIALFFGVLAVFAVGVDTIHSFFPLGSTGDLVLTLLEDGGEVVALTPPVALAFALALATSEPRVRAAPPAQTDVLVGRLPAVPDRPLVAQTPEA